MTTKRLTTEIFIQRSKAIHGDRYDYSQVKYVNARTKVKIVCRRHGLFEQKAEYHLRGHNCAKCKVEDTVTQPAHETEAWIEKAKKFRGEAFNYSLTRYVNSRTKVTIICNSCDTQFDQRPRNHLSGHVKNPCPKCSKIGRDSQGILAIKKWLSDYNLRFEVEKTFPECRNKRALPFDLYVPELNLLIEYHGGQHFKSVPFFGGNKRFKQRQANDLTKAQWAVSSGYRLITIKYDEDVSKTLSQLLENHKPEH